ncbi:MAG: CBS domain-containing protein [Desulfosarcina sp.]|nr:CBS domain-containing protein [Desulfosarcina sp.]MBC2766578.1 CBS domain-containing protein [Desulfosarcina sp.]
MLVKNWMSKDVVTVDENESMSQAIRLLKKKNIRMLPVMKDGKLSGIVTDRDLKKASASDATALEAHELKYVLDKIKVKTIMTKNPIAVPPDLTVEETAEILLKNKISGVPVVDDTGVVMGIITQTDLFKVIISLTGVGKKGIQFAFQVEDRPGSIKKIADVIRAHGGRTISILTAYDNVPEGYHKVYIRIYDIDRPRLQKLQDELIATAKLLYLVDHRENKRVIF